MQQSLKGQPPVDSDEVNKSSAVAGMGHSLATIDIHEPKSGGGAAVPLSVGELDLHPPQRCLGRGLPPYQVVS